MATELDLQPRGNSAPRVAPLRAGKPMGREGSSNDLALAMQAAALAADGDGPDLDELTDELIATRRAAMPKLDIEVLDVVRPLGMGGQGGVWLGVDPTSGIRMAIKQIRKGRLTMLPKKAMTRALTERECLHDVGHHPFITNCFATFQNDSSLFFCLELAPGGDLFGLLDTQPNGLPEHQARFYCSCIALALRHVHAHGWVYRDVKLENVLIDADGYIKICDFGFAKKAATSRTFTKCGTDEYAPPEVVSGRGRTCAADWWALGILLHEMLTGRPPFEGSSAEEVGALNAHSPRRLPSWPRWTCPDSPPLSRALRCSSPSPTFRMAASAQLSSCRTPCSAPPSRSQSRAPPSSWGSSRPERMSASARDPPASYRCSGTAGLTQPIGARSSASRSPPRGCPQSPLTAPSRRPPGSTSRGKT